MFNTLHIDNDNCSVYSLSLINSIYKNIDDYMGNISLKAEDFCSENKLDISHSLQGISEKLLSNEICDINTKIKTDSINKKLKFIFIKRDSIKKDKI